VQFAFMGAALAQVVLGIDQPRIGLLSNGEEEMKGTPLVREAHEALAGSQLRFVGNVEGLDITSGVADVIVTDGFTGNVALKVAEGVSQTMLEAVRSAAMSSTRAKLGGMLLRPSLRGLRDQLDPEGPGGAYLLGLRRLGVVPHGRFTRFGWSQAILLAARGVSGDVVGRTHAALEAAGALRARPAASSSEDLSTVPNQP
jgi:glycerol-3-phosphate acyltransferase PlsX